MEPCGDAKMIANGVWANRCYQMEVQLITDEWKNGEDFTGEVASENGRWVNTAAWGSNDVEKEKSNLRVPNESSAAKYWNWMPAECGK